MPMVWNEVAIAKLCSAILATTDVKVDHKKIADFMGPQCSHRAVETQLQKMRKPLKTSDLNGTATVLKIPKSSVKRKATKTASGDDDDVAEIDSTPSKCAKKAKA